MTRLNTDIPKMKMKPCSKTGVRLIYFYLSKSPFKLCFYGSRLNNLVPRAFLHFDKKDWRINCFHYFARPSFISKSENPNGCNEIEQKILWLFDVAWSVPKCKVSLICFFPYRVRIVSAFSRIWRES